MDLGVFSHLFAIIAPVFVAAAIGFSWARFGDAYDSGFISLLTARIAAPALIFVTLTSLPVPLSDLGMTSIATMIAIGLFAMGGFVILKVTRQDLRAFLPVLMFPNIGNMGLPLVLYGFGEDGMAFAIGTFVPVAILQYTLGVAIASGSFRLISLIRMPMIWAVILALPFALTETPLPAWLDNSTSMLSQMLVPLMLVTLGVSIASLRVSNVGKGFAMALGRLGLGLVVSYILAHVLGMEGAQKGAFIIQMSMPTAIMTYVFAEQYRRSPELVAASVLIGTFVSFVSLPLLLIIAGAGAAGTTP